MEHVDDLLKLRAPPQHLVAEGTREFLRKYPNGRIPAVEFDDGRLLFESGAIIMYFAAGTPFLSEDPFERAAAAAVAVLGAI